MRRPAKARRDPGADVAVALEPGARLEQMPRRRELGPEERAHPAHELLVVGEHPIHGLSNVVRVRISRLDGTKVEVEGHGLPHALRRLALLVEAEQRLGLPVSWTRAMEPRWLAYWALGTAHWTFDNFDRLFRALDIRDPSSKLLVSTPPEVYARIREAEKALRAELDFEELVPRDVNSGDLDEGAPA